jgi:hypothetical protein
VATAESITKAGIIEQPKLVFSRVGLHDSHVIHMVFTNCDNAAAHSPNVFLITSGAYRLRVAITAAR